LTDAYVSVRVIGDALRGRERKRQVDARGSHRGRGRIQRRGRQPEHDRLDASLALHDTEQYELTRSFLDDRDRFLHHLFADDEG
jgi:hypothetical protein